MERERSSLRGGAAACLAVFLLSFLLAAILPHDHPVLDSNDNCQACLLTVLLLGVVAPAIVVFVLQAGRKRVKAQPVDGHAPLVVFATPSRGPPST